jgi:cobalt-factor III methyltransferase
MPGTLHLVSIGPGAEEQITPAAVSALRESDVVVGYGLYLQLVERHIQGKEQINLPLTMERDRAKVAVEETRKGRTVSLVSSGDIGVYAMATLAFETLTEDDDITIKVHPGVTAALAAASILGAPLSHDFATLSLSDLLCPWSWIEHRARKIAEADLCVALYNVQSRTRSDGVYKILKLMLQHKAPDTVCGIVRNAYRSDQQAEIATLLELTQKQFDMFTTIVIGNKYTKRTRTHIYTPRGYNSWSNDAGETASTEVKQKIPAAAVWVFSGTSDGNAIADKLTSTGLPVVVSAATAYGGRIAEVACPNAVITGGSIGREGRSKILSESNSILILDATHPFSTAISEQLIALSRDLHIPYVRYERAVNQDDDYKRCIVAEDMDSAARIAQQHGTRILLTTGSKNIATFAAECKDPARLFIRITPSADSLAQVLQSGIPESNICAMQGPFTEEMNVAICRLWNIDCIVTKDSGPSGGLSEKIHAADKLQIPIVVIRRPAVNYPVVVKDWNELNSKLKELGVLN